MTLSGKSERTRTYDVLAMGRSCIDLYAHQVGVPITQVTSYDAYVGGCPTNVSVGSSRLGLRTALLTAVGDDQVADHILDFLRRERVDTQFIPRKPGRRTSAVIVTIRPPDDFPITFYRDNCADDGLTIEDVNRAPVADSRVVFVTGTGLSREPSRTATMWAAEKARREGATVVLDVDYRPVLWPNAETFGSAVRALARLAHLAIGTEQEVEAAANDGDANRAVRSLLELGPSAVVLKRGAEGATICRCNGQTADVPPFRVDILNTLGAGDAFASGFLYGFLHDWPLERAARLGNATGAIVVGRHGCSISMPTLREVEAFVVEQGGW
jgi:5-dehydro-2-deoxygluconokinase